MLAVRYSLPLAGRICLGPGSITCRQGLYFIRDGLAAECAPLPFFSRESLPPPGDDTMTGEQPSVAFPLSLLQLGLTPVMPRSSYPLAATSGDLKHLASDLRQDDLRRDPPEDEDVAAQRSTEQPGLPGCPRICKIKTGRLDSASEARAIRKFLEAIPDIRIILDPNMRWSRREAEDFIKSLPRERILYVEDLLPDPREAAAAARNCGVRLGLDQLLRQTDPASWDPGILGALVIKPMLTGSADQCRKLVDLALDAGIIPVISSSMESPWGLGLLTAWADSLPEPIKRRLLLGTDTLSAFPEEICQAYEAADPRDIRLLLQAPALQGCFSPPFQLNITGEVP